MTNTIKETSFNFTLQAGRYQGKVRDVYNIFEAYLVFVTSDRISAFDHILPRTIPYKGQVLNQTAAFFFEATKDIVPNHVLAVPDPNVTIGLKLTPYPIEMVVRGYLAGHAWRIYRDGGREICGMTLPEGLKQNDKLPEPILTPTTKSMIGHDMDISEREIIKSGIIPIDELAEIKAYAFRLYNKGSEMAKERGLILVDAKYEFGYDEYERIYVMDEIHTPDSARYFYAEGYEERQAKGETQKQLSKEFVREWLMANNFQGKDGQVMPNMPDEVVYEISNRYIEVYETLTGLTFEKANNEDIHQRIFKNTEGAISKLFTHKD